MIRACYYFLLWMHPASFKDEFGTEMLWIFNECDSSQSSSVLFPDVVLSLARQWLLRSDLWKFGLGAVVSAALMTGLIGPAAFLRPF